MEEFKLSNFRRAHPGNQLSVQRAGAEDVARLKAALLARLGLHAVANGSDLARAIANRAQPLGDLDACSDTFDVGRVLTERIGISLDDEVFLNWHWFEALDRMRAFDLASFFDDVWYPSADDLDVIGADAQWVLSIAHHGRVGLVKL